MTTTPVWLAWSQEVYPTFLTRKGVVSVSPHPRVYNAFKKGLRSGLHQRSDVLFTYHEADITARHIRGPRFYRQVNCGLVMFSWIEVVR